MDYVALKAELAQPAYAGLSNADAAAALHAVTATRAREYHATARSLMADLGPAAADAILAALEAAAPGNRIVARSLTLIAPAEGGIDLAHPETQAQLDGLQAAGVLTAAQVTALKGLAVETYNPWAEVAPWQVAHARGQV